MNHRKTAYTFLILGLLCITIGISYSLVSYFGEGFKEHVISSGSINFHYEEENQGITLNNAMPMSDERGKAQDKYFDFSITSKTLKDIAIPYYVTVRRGGTGTNMDDIVKVYLTTVDRNGVESPVKLIGDKDAVTVNELRTYINESMNISTDKNEKLLYSSEVPKNTSSYEVKYRLRMWIDNDAEYLVQNNGVTSYPYQGKTYTLKVNVYTSGESIAAPTGFILKDQILADNTLVTSSPTLDDSSNNTSDASGLYKMSVTDGFGGQDGDTYYFRGNVNNNKVKFAGLDWKIIRINEDGTIRLIYDGNEDDKTAYGSNATDGLYYYYSESIVKGVVETWYSEKITGDDASKVATGNYFCEAGKTRYNNNFSSHNTTLTNYDQYTPDLKCIKDGNNKGLMNNTVGLINYDEVVLAGGYMQESNDSYYLNNGINFWTMTGSGTCYGHTAWYVGSSGDMYIRYINMDDTIFRPVINLKSDVRATKDENGVYTIV